MSKRQVNKAFRSLYILQDYLHRSLILEQKAGHVRQALKTAIDQEPVKMSTKPETKTVCELFLVCCKLI